MKHGLDPPSNISFPKCSSCSYVAPTTEALARHSKKHSSVAKNNATSEKANQNGGENIGDEDGGIGGTVRARSLSVETEGDEEDATEESNEDDPEAMLSLLNGSIGTLAPPTLMMPGVYHPGTMNSSLGEDTLNTATTSIFSNNSSSGAETHPSSSSSDTATTMSLPKFEELTAGLPPPHGGGNLASHPNQEPFTIVNVAMPEHASLSDLNLNGQMLYLVPQQEQHQLSCDNGTPSNPSAPTFVNNHRHLVAEGQSHQQLQQQQQFNFQYSVPPNFDSLLHFNDACQLQPHSILVPSATDIPNNVYTDFSVNLGGSSSGGGGGGTAAGPSPAINTQFMYTAHQQQQGYQFSNPLSYQMQGQPQQQQQQAIADTSAASNTVNSTQESIHFN